MKWRIVEKDLTQIPKTGSYSNWKPQLADEAKYQCVYCCIHESNFGGIRNFHVEHYKPQSKFPTLKDAYSNLFYACGVCNIFKSDDWPGELASDDFSQAGYPDPSRVDYGQLLKVDRFSGIVSSGSSTGKYLIERLHLNRPHLIGLRAWAELVLRLEQVNDEFKILIDVGIPSSESGATMRTLQAIAELLIQLTKVRPYAPDQIK